MRTVRDLTVTKGRAKSSIEIGVTELLSEKITTQINQAVKQELPSTGVVTKFYPWLDKAEVKMDKTNKKILCKILHRHGGELLDFYTPFGEQTLCEKLKEPCVVPRDTLRCLVMNVQDFDSDEHLILGFYMNEEIMGIDPPKPGNMKLITRGGSNNHWVSFGYCGLDVRTSKEPTQEIGSQTDEVVPIEYANQDNVYDKEEVYNKEEVDELIEGGGGHGTYAVGSFTIDGNGHLIVQIPDGMSNPYTINSSGHLIYDTSATNNGGS